jgi:putative oxidoreductase
MLDLVTRLIRLFHHCVDALKPIAPLLARVVIGHAFLETGIGKWQSLPDIAEYFASLGIPAPGANAVFISSLEVVGGIALMLGIGTQLFAALLSTTMVVALSTADRAGLVGAITGSGDQALTEILPVVFLMPLTCLVAYGAGTFSLDYVLKKTFGATIAAPAQVPA